MRAEKRRAGRAIRKQRREAAAAEAELNLYASFAAFAEMADAAVKALASFVEALAAAFTPFREGFAVTDKTSPLPGQVLVKGMDFDREEYGEHDLDALDKTQDAAEANAILSLVDGKQDVHKVLLDIDFPVKAIPSSTPGHTHLYIDKEVSFDDLLGIVHAFADAGIVERGYADASEEQGFTTLRLPWIKKEHA